MLSGEWGDATPPGKGRGAPWDNSAPPIRAVVEPDDGASTAQHQGVSYLHYGQQQMPYAGTWGQPYYSPPMNAGPFTALGAGPSETLLPEDSTLGRAERRLRNALAAVGTVVRALGSVAQMLDSTAYAAWSSIMAIVAVGQHVRSFRDDHAVRWLGMLRRAVSFLFGSVKRTAIADGVIAANAPAMHSARERPASTLRSVLCVALPLAAAAGAYAAVQWCVSRANATQTDATEQLCGMARATKTYASDHPSALSVSPGDSLVVLQDSNDGWVLVRRVGSADQGFVPSSHVSPVESRS